MLTEGERWTRAALDDLRADRFSPAAQARFVLASSRRAADVRRGRPALARQSQRWMAIGAGAWLALAGAGVEPYRRRARGGLMWWAVTCLMLDWHLGMLETGDGRPRPLGPADALTLTRAWLVPVIADDLSPVAVLVAGATDVLDGALARAAEPTRAGRDLEGLVDSAAFVAAVVAGRRTGRLPGAAAALEGARVVAGIGYGLLMYVARSQEPDPRVTRAGRLTAPVRVAGLAAAGAGRRRLGGALVGGGSVAGIASLLASLLSAAPTEPR